MRSQAIGLNGTISARVVIAEPQSFWRAGFRVMLSSAKWLELVGEVAHRDDLFAVCRRHRPELIIMSLRLPPDGLHTLPTIRERYPEAKVVVVGLDQRPEHLRHAVRMGAHGFLPAFIARNELLSVLHRVLSAVPNAGQTEGHAVVLASGGNAALAGEEVLAELHAGQA